MNTLYGLCIQDQIESNNYIRYNITGALIINTGSYVTAPVSKISSNGTGQTTFGDDHNVIISFISNLSEVDTRLTDLEVETQNITVTSTIQL